MCPSALFTPSFDAKPQCRSGNGLVSTHEYSSTAFWWQTLHRIMTTTHKPVCMLDMMRRHAQRLPLLTVGVGTVSSQERIVSTVLGGARGFFKHLAALASQSMKDSIQKPTPGQLLYSDVMMMKVVFVDPLDVPADSSFDCGGSPPFLI